MVTLVYDLSKYAHVIERPKISIILYLNQNDIRREIFSKQKLIYRIHACQLQGMDVPLLSVSQAFSQDRGAKNRPSFLSDT